ncbi:hypothetical protein [Variovorax sp. PBL-E5]|uniref:hypothetical protein n=1 Tax=Variovorax sp. PBL-E5 TaxID=434014 RepID=UPI0013A53D63|nr:hypothetical protein [Variovorax sp. PBL-E5]
MQNIDFIGKSGAQNSIDSMEGPGHAGLDELLGLLATKLSTETVRQRLQRIQVEGQTGSVDNRRAFAVHQDGGFFCFPS